MPTTTSTQIYIADDAEIGLEPGWRGSRGFVYVTGGADFALYADTAEAAERVADAMRKLADDIRARESVRGAA